MRDQALGGCRRRVSFRLYVPEEKQLYRCGVAALPPRDTVWDRLVGWLQFRWALGLPRAGCRVGLRGHSRSSSRAWRAGMHFSCVGTTWGK